MNHKSHGKCVWLCQLLTWLIEVGGLISEHSTLRWSRGRFVHLPMPFLANLFGVAHKMENHALVGLFISGANTSSLSSCLLQWQ